MHTPSNTIDWSNPAILALLLSLLLAISSGIWKVVVYFAERQSKDKGSHHDLAREVAQLRDLILLKEGYAMGQSESEKLAVDLHNEAVDMVLVGRISEAIKNLERALELDPKNFKVLNVLGFAYSFCEEHELAVAMLQKAARLSPDNLAILTNLGVALAKSGDIVSSIQMLKEALALGDVLGVVRFNLAMSYGKLGREDLAIRYLKDATRKYRRSPQAFSKLAQIAFQNGEVRNAEKLFKKAYKVDHLHIPAMEGLAAIFTATNRTDLAIPLMEQLTKITKDQDYYLDKLASLYAVKGRYQEATELITSLEKRKYISADLLNTRAICFMGNGQNSRAEQELVDAIREFPDEPYLHFNLARLLIKKGDKEGGQNALSKAIAIDGEHKQMALKDSELQGLVSINH